MPQQLMPPIAFGKDSTASIPSELAGVFGATIWRSFRRTSRSCSRPTAPLSLLRQRVIVVGGEVKRPIDARIIACVVERDCTGKAKQFKFVGRDDEDYKYQGPTKA
jgi:hypothetical protein